MRFTGDVPTDPPDLPVPELVACLERHPVRLSVLFGSYADDQPSRLSDLDVAVLFDEDTPGTRGTLLDSLTADIIDFTGIDAVDSST